MNRQQAAALFSTPLVVLLAPAPLAVAADYLTVAQAQRAIFPEARAFEPVTGRGRPAAAAWPAARLAGARRDRSARIFFHR